MGLQPIANSWEDEIAQEAATEFKAVISIYHPGETVTVPYDPVSGLGGDTVPVYIAQNVPARAQHIRTPDWQKTTYDVSAYRHYRFQIAMADAPAAVPKGYIVRIEAIPRDPSLVGYTATVQASTNSSNAAVRTIETLGAAT